MSDSNYLYVLKKYELFIFFYISSFFVNETQRWENAYVSVLYMFFLLLFLYLEKYRKLIFIIFLIFSTFFLFEKYPRLANHSTLLFFLNIYFLVFTTYKYIFIKNHDFISENDFLLLRWVLILVYFFTGFHKLNFDFLFSENSCANWYHNKLLFLFLDEVVKPYPQIIYFISPFLVVCFEIIESFLLMFKKTQLFSLYSFLLLHFYLSLGGFFDFAIVCISLMIAFVPVNNYNNNAQIILKKINLKFLKFSRLELYSYFLIIISLSIYFEREYEILQNENHRYIVFISGTFYIVNLVFLSWDFIKIAYSQKILRWNSENLFYKVPIRIYFCLSFLFFHGFQNYLGLSTAGTFAMFSNLRTEGGSSNHLLLKNNPLEFFDYQKDLVYIHKIIPPYYKINYTVNNIKNKIIPKVVFEEYLYNLKSLGIKKVDVIIEYKTDKILVKNILNDKFWTPNKLELKHRYLFFRKINLGKNIECVW